MIDRSTPSNAVDAAIAQVLAAEQAAHGATLLARAEAARVAEASRAAVRALGERTEARIRRLRAAFEQQTDAAVAALQAQAQALTDAAPPTAGELARVDRAVTQLAAQLSGGAPP